MQQLFCSYTMCNQPLKSGSEILTGLCDRHHEEALNEDNFVGICWQCGRITLNQSRRFTKDFKIKDKYIFAEGCEACTGDAHKGIMWMTIRVESEPSSAVTLNGNLVPYVEGTTISAEDKPLSGYSILEDNTYREDKPISQASVAESQS